MKPILEIQNVSKKFRIDHEKQPYLSLRDRLSNLLHSTATKEDFWALKDVSFDVMPGDTVGIIGKNGAGKSTLLKILSKITPPTSGKIIFRGRIASLLEVGTGFHPELSGRENVFLNGSILGMKRSEILSKFDEIVDFAGVERFIDTPLKHYSSGMQLRLAFAVAAFLQNEILIIDEVLAVGDAEFQKKCLGKMEDVSRSGRTVLFVSHNMDAVRTLCRKGVLLAKGICSQQGDTDKILDSYLHANINETYIPKFKLIKTVEVFTGTIKTKDISSGESLEIRASYSSENILHLPVLGIIIKDSYNTPLIGLNNKNTGFIPKPNARGEFSFIIPNLPLSEGVYSVDLRLGDGFKELEIVEDAVRIHVHPPISLKGIERPIPALNKIHVHNAEFKMI